jgi:hypothetical protein
MAGRFLRGLLVLAFAAAVGHVAWHALAGPPLTPEYFIEGEGKVLTAPDPEAQVLYLRRTLWLSRRPRHAWLEVVGRDCVRVYVNGHRAGEKRNDGFPVGVVVDLAPLLTAGRNVLAVSAEQASVGYPPAVAVRGACRVGGVELPIRTDASWRCSTTYARGADWWFSPDFQDGHWPTAPVTDRGLRSAADAPPRATTEAGIGRWVGPPSLASREAAVRRDFTVPGRPRRAWLRVTATAPYLLAVNGVLLDAPEDGLAATPVPPVQRTYDITAAVRRGANRVAFLLTADDRLPHVLADLEVEDGTGARCRLGTDGTWLSRPGPPGDWSEAAGQDSADWKPCVVAPGDLNVPPWLPARRFVAVAVPLAVALGRVAREVGFIAILAVLTWLGCRLAGRQLARRCAAGGPAVPAPVAYLALVPATVALAGAVLATYDPQVARQDVYRGLWVLLAVASVPVQWGLLALAARRPAVRLGGPALGRVAAAVLLAGLVGAGLWLRLQNIAVEPMMWDEVLHYNGTRGFLENGYPSMSVGPGAPPRGVATSELMYVSMGLAALFVDDPLYVVRVPALIFGTATIVLIYVVGRRLFGRPVGWAAAALYALAPPCVGMGVFGRYVTQLQFFTLLTVYFFWLALRPEGGLSRRYVWLTALAFCAAYLTWEGSALLAPGMILAALFQRRGRLRTLFANRAVWAASASVLVVLLLQGAFRQMVQAPRLKYQLGLGALPMTPNWRYPGFDAWYYVRQATWNVDTLLPLVGLALAGLLAVRSACRRPLRFLLLIHLVGCLLLAALLSITAFRYAYHQIPLGILLASAAFVACARALAGAARSPAAPAAWRLYARGLGAATLLAVLALGSGLTVQLGDLPGLRVYNFGTSTYRFPGVAGPLAYLRAHLREGDVVVSPLPHHVTGLVARPGWSTDYLLESYLVAPLELTDDSPVPVDSRCGAVVLLGRRDLEDLFARRRRIWYLAVPEIHANVNSASVSAYLREHMEVVEEGWHAVLLFRGDRHWPADQRQEAGRALPGTRAPAGGAAPPEDVSKALVIR